MEVTVTVTKETYEESRERLRFSNLGRSVCCPVALATQKTLGLQDGQVGMGYTTLKFYTSGKTKVRVHKEVVPPLAKAIVEGFDLEECPEVYGSFTLHLPDDLLEKLKGASGG